MISIAVTVTAGGRGGAKNVERIILAGSIVIMCSSVGGRRLLSATAAAWWCACKRIELRHVRSAASWLPPLSLDYGELLVVVSKRHVNFNGYGDFMVMVLSKVVVTVTVSLLMTVS